MIVELTSDVPGIIEPNSVLEQLKQIRVEPEEFWCDGEITDSFGWCIKIHVSDAQWMLLMMMLDPKIKYNIVNETASP